MSNHKHNYSQHYNNNKPKPEIKMVSVSENGHPDPVGDPGPVGHIGDVQHDIKNVQETVDTKPTSETITGMVVGCAKLNVRAEASLFADIVCVLNTQSEIMIDINKSDKEWFCVCTATGIEGYCLRKFVEARL